MKPRAARFAFWLFLAVALYFIVGGAAFPFGGPHLIPADWRPDFITQPVSLAAPGAQRWLYGLAYVGFGFVALTTSRFVAGLLERVARATARR